MNRRPIGVFDSGLGGLTAVKMLMSIAPFEDIVYLGDTARVPYGNRAAKTIRRYAAEAIAFLQSKNVKFLVDACGTMSSALSEEYTRGLKTSYTGVILPAAKAALGATKNKKIGVIATAATVATGAFPRAIAALDPSAEVFADACPLFVALVENGYVDAGNPITAMIARDHLRYLKQRGVDTLILGCTHYPLISSAISDVMGGGVVLIDSGGEAAKSAVEQLAAAGGLQPGGGRLECYITDGPIRFREIAEMFLGRELPEDISVVDIDSF